MTSIANEYEESVETKEEIIEERYPDGEHKHLSVKSELDERSLSSDKKTTLRTEIVYEYDENLEIKEEIIQDQETVSRQKMEEKYETKLNTVENRNAEILAAYILRIHQEKKIQEPESKPKKKYKCQKCARTYKYKHSLNIHQKFKCGITPQFICKFCDKQFKLKDSMCRHVAQAHQKKDPNQNKRKVQESKQEPEKNDNIYRHQMTNSDQSQTSYNCNKCFRSYSSSRGLYRHNRVQHAEFKRIFMCDVCGYKASLKSHLSRHILSRHFKNSTTVQATHNGGKCSRSYSSLKYLNSHSSLKHATVKPRFICDVCSYETNVKFNLSRHISSRHFKNTKRSEARHKCDKCSINYTSLDGLKRHNRLKHATVKPQIFCDACSYETYSKHNLSRHFSLRHFK